MFGAFARLMNSGFSQLSPDEAAQRKDLTVVDVRQKNELHGDLGHIPGSVHIPLDRLFSAGPPSKWKPETPLLVVCRSGARSASAASQLAQMGFTDLYNLQGGMIAWNRAGLPVKGRHR
ncbi:MAG TPA: rhodanese-like domain-containing protein [bacterium]|nr:rhodanese-like domain-containing protein [bacterium]